MADDDAAPQPSVANEVASATSLKSLAGLRPTSWLVWYYLCTEPESPRVKDIVDAVGKSENSVLKALRQLRAGGLIEIDKSGPHNDYDVIRRPESFGGPPTAAALRPPKTPMPTRRHRARDGYEGSWPEVIVANELDRLGIPFWAQVELAKLVPGHDGRHRADFFAPPYVIEVAMVKNDPEYDQRLALKVEALRKRGFKVIVITSELELYSPFDDQFVETVQDTIVKLLGTPERRDRFRRGFPVQPANQRRIDMAVSAWRERHRQADRGAAYTRKRCQRRPPLHASRKPVVAVAEEFLQAARGLVSRFETEVAWLYESGEKELKDVEVRIAQEKLRRVVRDSPMLDGAPLLRADKSDVAQRRRSWAEAQLDELDQRLAARQKEFDDMAELAFHTREGARQMLKKVEKLLAEARDEQAVTRSQADVLEGHLTGLTEALDQLGSA